MCGTQSNIRLGTNIYKLPLYERRLGARFAFGDVGYVNVTEILLKTMHFADSRVVVM